MLSLSPRGRLCRFIPSRFHAETAEAPRFTFDYVDGAQGFTFSAANLRLMRVVVR